MAKAEEVVNLLLPETSDLLPNSETDPHESLDACQEMPLTTRVSAGDQQQMWVLFDSENSLRYVTKEDATNEETAGASERRIPRTRSSLESSYLGQVAKVLWSAGETLPLARSGA